MEDIKKFEDFYSLKIQPNIARFQREDKLANTWGVLMVVSILFTLISFIVVINSSLSSIVTLLTIVLAIFSLYSVYYYYRKENLYVNDFKQNVIKEVINYLHPNLNYETDKVAKEKYYRRSGLFRWNYEYFDGDDYIEGIYKDVPFNCSEVRTYTTERGSSRRDNIGEDNNGNIFKGLFFTATVNSGYTGGTYIWVRGLEQLGNSIADERYRLLKFPQTVHIKTGNPIFDDYYSVYSTNPAEAHSIVDDELMQNLLQFRKQIKRKVSMSVVMGKCHVAIPIKDDLFEPTSFPDDKEVIKEYFFLVLLILSIINQLNLRKLL